MANHVNDASVVAAGLSPTNIQLIRWVLTTADPVGDWVVIPSLRDYSVHVFGTFGGATLDVQGSNEAGTPANPAILRDTRSGANTLSFATAGIAQGLEATLKMRPNLSAVGVGASITCIIKFARD